MDFKQMTQTQLAQAVGRTSRAIRDWDCPRNQDGSYSLPDVIKWMVAEAEDRVRPASDPEEVRDGDWLDLYRKERATITRLEREQLEKKLCPVAEVEAAFTDRAFELSRGLLLMSRRIAHRIAGKSKKAVKAVAAIVDEEVRGMMDTYSKPIDLEFEVLKK